MLPTVCVAVLAVTAPDARAVFPFAEWAAADRRYADALDAAKTRADRERVWKLEPDAGAAAARMVAACAPGSPAELSALVWAATNAPQSPAGARALAALAGGRLERADPAVVLAALEFARTRWGRDDRPLAPGLVACAKRDPGHPKAARLLAAACVAFANDGSEAAPPAFREAADLIAARHAGSPDIFHFLEALFLNGGPAWAGGFDRHVQAVLAAQPKGRVRLRARYAEAVVARAAGRQADAERLFRRFVADYTPEKEHGVTGSLLEWAGAELARIERRGVGKPAGEIAGVDLAGKPLTLSEHKGKVVLVVFWASWCGPCLADVPHEKELHATFAGRPFVILGVNGDKDASEADAAVKAAGIPWRSVRNTLPGGKTASEAWAVSGWPTVVVVDHAGVIRYDDLRGKRLDGPLERLVAAAEAARK